MKKTAIWLIVFALAVTMTFMGIACKATTTTTTASAKTTAAETTVAVAETTAAAETTPIKMVWSGSLGEEEADKPSVKNMMDSWNMKNPNATVEWIGWPWAEALNQLVIRSQAGEGIDVADIDTTWLAALGKADVLVDLNTVFKEEYLSNFEQAGLETCKANGKQVALPWTLASIGMLYSPKLLKEAGINSAPKTIEEFENACKVLKDKYPDIIPFGAVTKDPGSMAKDFGAWIWTFGGSIFDKDGNVVINGPGGVAALTWYKSMLDKGYIAMDLSRFDLRVLFAQQRVCFYEDAIVANGFYRTNMELKPSVNIDEDIMPMLPPVLKAGDAPQSTAWGHVLGIMKTAQNVEKAGEFLQHVVSKDQAIDFFNKTGMLPGLKSVLESDIVKNNSWANKWSEITSTSRASETSFYSSSAELNTIISEEMQAALIGTKSPQQALDDAKTRIEIAIAAERK